MAATTLSCPETSSSSCARVRATTSIVPAPRTLSPRTSRLPATRCTVTPKAVASILRVAVAVVIRSCKKTCTLCGIPKPESDFYRYGKERNFQLHARCKSCQHEARGEHRKANPSMAAAVARRQKLKLAFTTPEEFDTVVVIIQGNVCAICGRPSPDGRRLHADHNHETKEFRGGLCHDCNRGLGIFRDSPELLEAAAKYLRDPPACWECCPLI